MKKLKKREIEKWLESRHKISELKLKVDVSYTCEVKDVAELWVEASQRVAAELAADVSSPKIQLRRRKALTEKIKR